MIKLGPENAGEAFDMVEAVKADLRKLETLGKPVVAAINGAALGGGLEIALACHHRIIADVPGAVVGFPEVTLGLLPGGGGVDPFSVRMFGIQKAFMEVLSQGTRFKPGKAKEVGLVDEVLPTVDELVPAAKAWIKANPDSHTQPWDAKGYKMPGGTPSSPGLAGILPSFPALLKKQLKGAPMPAPRAILDAAVEGAQVDFDTASRIESRYFTSLVTGQVAKNMIQAFFLDLQYINSGGSRPDGIGKTRDQQDRRARRGNDGRGHRLRLGQGRVRRRAQGRVASRPRRRARATPRSSKPRRSSAARPRRRSPTRCWPASPRPPTPPTSRASTSSSRRCSSRLS